MDRTKDYISDYLEEYPTIYLPIYLASQHTTLADQEQTKLGHLHLPSTVVCSVKDSIIQKVDDPAEHACMAAVTPTRQ